MSEAKLSRRAWRWRAQAWPSVAHRDFENVLEVMLVVLSYVEVVASPQKRIEGHRARAFATSVFALWGGYGVVEHVPVQNDFNSRLLGLNKSYLYMRGSRPSSSSGAVKYWKCHRACNTEFNWEWSSGPKMLGKTCALKRTRTPLHGARLHASHATARRDTAISRGPNGIYICTRQGEVVSWMNEPGRTGYKKRNKWVTYLIDSLDHGQIQKQAMSSTYMLGSNLEMDEQAQCTVVPSAHTFVDYAYYFQAGEVKSIADPWVFWSTWTSYIPSASPLPAKKVEMHEGSRNATIILFMAAVSSFPPGW
ncbi:hypothetical protein K438DRAFT_1760016 [Mycena galopus ATCC 62051]|nr:hypothetical protein K438DRAFT_1760016 [Mycena galopus ATCC 62051]